MRWTNLSIELRKLKYKVFVLTFGDENKIFEDNGIVIIQRKIIRPFNFLYRSKNKNLSKGVIDSSQNLFLKFLSWCRVNLFYPDARFLQYNNLIQFLTKFINENNINTIISSSPPHSIHKIVLKLKKTRKFKWILDFRDPYLNWDILLSMNPTFISKWIHSSFQKYFLKSSDYVIVTNSNLKKEFSKVINKEKIELIHNGSNINPSSYQTKKFIISYFGLINKFRDPKVLIDVIDELLSENNEIKEKFEFHVYGNIQPSTINYLKLKKNLIKSLKINSFISFKKLQNRLDSSSVLLLLLNNNETQNTTPYKIFDYLVSERPILTLSNFKNPDVEYLLKKYKRNRTIGYDDRKEIKDFIISSFNNFNQGKLKNIKCDYSNLRYDKLAKKYKDIIES
tara:strand:- start:2455 stop:3639 length:1185 start_codon:yes stop_codon:yes gene_type:complete